jgi:hypothetical protein
MEAAENRASHDLAVLGQEMSVVKLQQVWLAMLQAFPYFLHFKRVLDFSEGSA